MTVLRRTRSLWAAAVYALRGVAQLAVSALRSETVRTVEQPSLLSFSLLGEVLFLGRRLLEQPRLSTPYCSGNLKIFDLKIFALKMKTKMKMGCFH